MAPGETKRQSLRVLFLLYPGLHPAEFALCRFNASAFLRALQGIAFLQRSKIFAVLLRLFGDCSGVARQILRSARLRFLTGPGSRSVCCSGIAACERPRQSATGECAEQLVHGIALL